MRVKLIILILQTLKHFNDVLNSLYHMAYRSDLNDIETKSINKKLSKEIKYQESNLVK